MSASHTRIIARRKLAYAIKGEHVRTSFSICIGEPFLLTENNTGTQFAENAGGCVIRFEGLPEKELTVHGADTIQALELAIGAAENYLRRLSKKYNFYFDDADGDPYFDDQV